MKRALVAVVVLVAALAGAASSSPGSATVHALVWERNTLSLATLDARTLAPRGRLLALGRASGVTTDALGDRLAMASAVAGIVIVDTRRMRVVWRLAGGRPNVRAVSWISPSRLLVVQHGSALLLDPVQKRIVGQTVYDGVVRAAAAWRDGLVLLVGGTYTVQPARVLVVGPGVRIRTLELARIPAGSAEGPTDEYPFNHAQPGLAVDEEGGRAYVAGGNQIARIDLGALAVSYGGADRTLQKVITGPRRSAAWLGAGTLVVAGADERWTDTGQSSTPFGLRYVRRDRVTIVDERATEVRVAGGVVLAYGSRYSSGRAEGMGLAAYDSSGTLRWHVFGDSPIDGVQVAKDLAYVPLNGVWNIVDLTTGAILNSTTSRWKFFQVIG